MISFDQGYFVKDASHLEPLNEIRSCVHKLVEKHILGGAHDDAEFTLNNLHTLMPNMSEAEFNERRMALISELNETIDCGELIFSVFKDIIVGLLGPDIIVQKNSNVVLQVPRDPNPSELHRDAPANSPYELVVWVPLVDCYKTKAMYILDYANTKSVFDKMELDPNWVAVEAAAKAKGVTPDVKFGQALFFSTAVLHGSEVNEEEETRVSLNIRFKNIFSPSGFKNQLQFFKQLQISDMVRIGTDVEAQVLQSKGE